MDGFSFNTATNSPTCLSSILLRPTLLLSLHYHSSTMTVTVGVRELDFDQKHNDYHWVEVKHLNGRIFFVAKNSSGAWCWGNHTKHLDDDSIGGGIGIAGNCIFIYMPDYSEHTLLLYNLLDQTCTTLPLCPSLVTPCDSPLWVIPQQLQQQQSRLSASEEQNVVDQKVSVIECPQTDVENNNILSKLPLHIIELVADHMHLFEYWSFRVTTKILRSILPKPHRRRCINNDYPLFMVFSEIDRLFTIIDPSRHDSRSNNNVLPSLPDSMTLEFCKNGWLLYLVGNKLLEYVNVLTTVTGGLPPLPTLWSNQQFHSIAFSTYPTCSECLTVAMYGCLTFISFSYIRFGDEEWNTSYFEQEFPFYPTSSTPVFVKGAFYYMDVIGNLGEFRLMDKQKPTWQVYYDKPRIQTGLNLSSLVDCNGQLYSIFVGNMGNWIQVFWFDYSSKCWVEVHHLENLCFFISRKSTFSIVTKDDHMRNKIFLPWIRNKSIVYYSLSTKKFHIWGDHDMIVNLLGLKEPLKCCWF